ncbi:hypothetical protein [Sphingomonas immobilis]|uniref:Gluconolaconase n=1 Tax=Sphingomonas immobilis TaxID=3063997 RepID=A0ABT9A582_9SPHN|nr:hypothetical protein [Sphingomonas sp. CA1-15]MDO7843892.1 hypothetical protein [Sphingomonas sp. CA1-15]
MATAPPPARSRRKRLSRKAIAISLLLALALTAGGIWWLSRLARPVPTVFGGPVAVETVAGDGVAGRDDGLGMKARFNDPFALAFDANGMLYVADAGDSDRIRKVDAEGHVTTLPGSFDTPSGIAIDAAGNIFVAETGANRIRRIDATGALTTFAGNGVAGFRDGPAAQAQFDGPIGLAVDAQGNVYVADTYNDRIRVIGADGQVRTLAGGAQGFADGDGAVAAFNTPSGIALDKQGTLLIADTGNDAIRRLDKDGRVSTLAYSPPEDDAGPLRAPVALARTWDGFLYISSFRRDRIVQMSPAGELRILAGRGTAIAGNDVLLARPAGLALDRAGALYVADSSNHAVRKIGPRQSTPPPGPALRTDPPALTRLKDFPWPVAPQHAWHEVVGTLGEVRGNYQGESRDHLHAGLDIRADVGQPVLAVADEKVADPLPNWTVEGLSEGMRVDAMTYIHMRVGRTPKGDPIDPARFRLTHDATGRLTGVRVKRGTRFRVGDVLGTVNRMAHVHLELGQPGSQVNAIALRFTGFTDRFAPRINAVQVVDAAGQPLKDRQKGRLIVPANGGVTSIVVDAWDQVDGNAPRRRLGLYRAGFRILRADGTPLPGFERPRITLEFDRLPRGADVAKIAYAPASGDAVHSDQPTRFHYVVTNRVRGGKAEAGSWNPAGLAPGDYIIRIFAADFAGNQAVANRDLPITIR